jgi:hypothetical protein
MTMLKSSVLGLGLLLTASLSAQPAGSAQAAGFAPATANHPMQLAQATPEPAYPDQRAPGPKASSDDWIPPRPVTTTPPSPERYPGPKIGPSGWIPASAPTPPAPAGADDRGAHPYSQHGTGPMPN